MDYSKKTVSELKEICKEQKIKYKSNVRKNELIALLKKAEPELPSSSAKPKAEPELPSSSAKPKAEPTLKSHLKVHSQQNTDKTKANSKMNVNSAHNMLINIIKKQKEKEEQNDIWKDSPYKDLVKLQSNNVGNVGEEFVDALCKSIGIDSNCNGSKTKQIGGGEGDGKILGAVVEIKTAHQGSTSPTFQHELGEVPWKSAKYMIFVDISPTCIYLTIFKNFDEATYKGKTKLPYFPTKTVTWRKEKGAFKLDTSVKINEESVKSGHAIKITPDISNESIGEFIQKMIV